jgi:hypothetical protein
MRAPVALLLATFAAALLATTADAKLTPAEQKWATPMIQVWNQQNLALHVVLQAAAAKNALVVGTPNNQKLTTVLNTFVVCGPSIKKAGTPPSPRLTAFASALTTACTHDTTGARDFASAVGAVRKGKAAQSATFLKKGVAEFKLGSSALNTAYKSLIALGGQNIFKA